ncbi:hypothetical protein MMYC01_207604 [Madurella mycetomatis]|uniref:Velvet domain-containing protein n=1 Tax=Madurella mycetomatis TaxID=100816 RepID=A0A175W015_9PEZI|nr:hypothetical protein MMYC01_207604 [Madurella mycetomatis]
MMTSLGGGDFELAVRQQPKYACVAIGKGKERKPIDPPPIVQLMVSPRKDPAKTFLQNPYLILTARLIRKGDEESDEQQQGLKESDLAGTLVSSLYSLKDTDNSQGGFFVFGDLSVRRVGTYRLAFILYELKLAEKECWLLSRTVSDPFVVYATKTFPGLAESTFLTRSFSDQGVRLRLRKDSRTVSTKKRSIGVATQADQIRASQGIHGYLPHDGNHDLSPNGHSSHHIRRLSSLQEAGMQPGQLDRSRGSLGSQGSYYGDSPQMRGGEYGSGSYGYSPYDDKPSKRARMDGDDGSHGGYESDYHPYTHHAHHAHHSGPRTVPDTLGSMYPTMTTSYPVPTQPALATTGLPMPTAYGSMPRLDTTQIPPHSPAPNSAASTSFSPGTRRSPGSAYPYPPVQPPPQTTAIFTSPTTLPYHHAAAGSQLPHQSNGLGIALPHLDLEGVEKQAQSAAAQGM